MSDQGFDFQRAPETKEPPKFEPPPWEREAFEALQAKRASEEAARVEAEEAARAAEEAATGAEAAATGVAVPGGQTRVAVPPVIPTPLAVPAVVPVEAEVPQAAGQPAQPADDEARRAAQVEMMLMQLAAEEPSSDRAIAWVTGFAALLVGPLGLVMVVWGMAGMVKADVAEANAGLARTVAAILLSFGVMFVALAMWLVYRLLKRRGV